MTKTITLELPDDVEQALQQRSARCNGDVAALVFRMVTEGLALRQANPEYLMEKQIPGFAALFPAKEYLVDVSRAAIYDFRDDSGIIRPEEVACYRQEQIAEAMRHLDKLTAEQQVAPFQWADEFRYGHWPDEETAEELTAFIREHRSTSLPRERLI